MVSVLIFSKDRGCQLELLLRSIKIFWSDNSSYKISILYKYSNTTYKEGYIRTIKKHPEFNYIEEVPGSFKNQVISLINTSNLFTIFFVDDDVFKEPFKFNCQSIFDFYENKDIACLSLRLYPKINYCYTMRIPTPQPTFISKNIWSCNGTKGDWNYKMSVDGHIFRTEDIMGLVKLLPYANPNTFEGILASHEITKPLMMCFDKAAIFNMPINKVQTVNGNYCGNITAEYLNQEYLLGKYISIKNISYFNNTSVHQEIPIELIYE